MELKDFAEKVIEVDVEWFGEIIKMGIRPGVWTNEKLVAMLAPATSDEDSRTRDAKAYVETIAWWDITDKGKPWPVTVDNIKKLPQGLITAIPDALARKVREEGKT